jgi:hypothetical protein
MFKIICIFAVFFCATASCANKSSVSVATKSSVSWISQPPGDNASRSEISSIIFPHDKEKDTLQRLQLGVFPNRTEVEGIVVRLNKLDFETWITPFKDGYAVSIGAFSSQTNLQRAMQRLKNEGFADKIQVVEVDKPTQHPQAIATTQAARSTLFDARGFQLKEQFVPNKKYKKLEKKVERLESQVQHLMEGKTPVKQESNSVRVSDTQAKTKSSDTHAASSEDPVAAPTESDDSHAEKDENITEGDRQREAEDAKRQMDMFLRQQTVLFKRGELELEFGLNYSLDTAFSTCFNPDRSSEFCPRTGNSGVIVVPKINSRSVDTSLGVTYGIADNLALSLSLPYSYHELETDFSPFEGLNAKQVSSDSFSGIGDVGGSLRYTAWHEKGNIPGITLNVNAKSQTGNDKKLLGTGFWNVGAGISLTKTFDPVVFFGSVGYTAALQNGEVDPGDQISYSFGGGFALNDRVNVSTAFSGSTVLRTEVSGREIPGSDLDINSLQFSSTIKISKALFIEPFVVFGLSRESGDFTVGLRVPYRFGDRFPLPFFHD